MEREGERRNLTLEKSDSEKEDIVERLTLKQELVKKEFQVRHEAIIQQLILLELRERAVLQRQTVLQRVRRNA